MDEIRKVDPDTGAEKGTKLERFDLIPAQALAELARHFGVGSLKYSERNWERGYDWSLSFAAMQRHAWAFWNGEDIGQETGSKHIISCCWHCICLATLMDTYPKGDNRVKNT